MAPPLQEKSYGQRSLVGYSSWGCKDMTEQLSKQACVIKCYIKKFKLHYVVALSYTMGKKRTLKGDKVKDCSGGSHIFVQIHTYTQ